MKLDPRRRALVLLFLAVLALSIAGCGGGSSTAAPAGSSASGSGTAAANVRRTPSSSDPALSKSQLVARADTICKRLNAEIVARETPGASVQEVIRVVPGNASLEQEALKQLAKLSAPASLSRDWQQILAGRRTLATQLLALVQDAKHDDVRAMQALSAQKKRVHGTLRAVATRDGFRDCSEVGAGPPRPSAAPQPQI
jgi:hypothetical protein